MSDIPTPPPPPDEPPVEPPVFGGSESINLDSEFPFEQPQDFSSELTSPPALPPPLPDVAPPSVPLPPPEIDAAPSLETTPPPPPSPGTAVTSAFGSKYALSWGEPTTKDDRNLALMAHLMNIIFVVMPIPVLPPLLLFALFKDKSKYIGYHALQATLVNVGIWVLSPFTCGLSLIVGPVLSLIWALKAYEGKWEGYPAIDQVGR